MDSLVEQLERRLAELAHWTNVERGPAADVRIVRGDVAEARWPHFDDGACPVLRPGDSWTEPVNATLPVSLVMVRAIREYHERTGHKVGFKPAGGIKAAKQSLDWLILMKEELGDDWLKPELFRLGASSLLGDIERQLEHHITGQYSASFRHPMA